MTPWSRREFLAAGAGAVPVRLGAGRGPAAGRRTALDEFIASELRVRRIPGLAACIVKGGRVVWAKGYGWASIGKRLPMDPDRTVQSLGSIAKTVTATAVMQLWERGAFRLDEDVGRFLPFAVRSPAHPATPITFRHLLTHRSGLADGPAYGASYACGDPRMPLGEWVEAYLTPGGRHYQRDANFHPWAPGERASYSNVAFGLLGYLVERMSGQSFPHYTKTHIFDPLGMTRTAWRLSEVDAATHAVPYAPAGDDPPSEELRGYERSGLTAGEAERDPVSGAYQPLCLYGFPNYPDGALRTSAGQLARFLLAYSNGGAHGGARVLDAATVRLMLRPQVAAAPDQGLCWRATRVNGQLRWGHNGSDPGTRTMMAFRPSDGVGAIVFVNRGGVDVTGIHERLFLEATRD